MTKMMKIIILSVTKMMIMMIIVPTREHLSVTKMMKIIVLSVTKITLEHPLDHDHDDHCAN